MRRQCQGRTASDRAPTGQDLVRTIATTTVTMTATGWGAGRTCIDDRCRCHCCGCRHRCDCHLPTADSAACDDYYYNDDDCRGEDPPDDGRRTTSHSSHGGCHRHPPRAGRGAPVAIFMVAVSDGPPVTVGRAVAIAVRRPLLLLLLHRCRRCCRLTIDPGNAATSRGTGLAPPASATVVAVIRRHCQVDRVEPLHPRHVGCSGNQYCFPLPPSPSPCRPVGKHNINNPRGWSHFLSSADSRHVRRFY
jgi:hypothetical protein